MTATFSVVIIFSSFLYVAPSAAVMRKIILNKKLPTQWNTI